ncbi:MAG: hypothetical protein RLZ35_414 [Pseudomonadota bacterium]|jgi:hypothetical protein
MQTQNTQHRHTMPDIPTLSCDVAIIGAGIAGLWTAHRLKQAGFTVVLVEPYAIGAGQTICSQGIIHGGLKYALTGTLSSASESIADMPNIWRACLAGEGVLDLSAAKVLSEAQYLWSTGSLKANVFNFFASKCLKSRVKKVKKDAFPAALQHPAFKGNVYQLNEPVLDIASVLQALATPLQSAILQVDGQKGYQVHYATLASNAPYIDHLSLSSQGRQVRLTANHYVFTAGQGNAQLAEQTAFTSMQKRPLQMVTCTFPAYVQPPSLYGHCIDDGATPRMTVTTHPMPSNPQQVTWYLGGKLAEEGVLRSMDAQILVARETVGNLLPWIDLSGTHWRTICVNRAEPLQPSGQKPDTAHVELQGNICLAWPTKLALSPRMADKILSHLQPLKITGKHSDTRVFQDTLAKLNWPTPRVANLPWESE